MAQGSSDGEVDPNDIVTSHTLTQMQQLTTANHSPLELPGDLLPEILCRLPVKLLFQLRCVCKFFNSLISDPKFAKKHIQLSTKRHHLMVTFTNNLGETVHHDSPIPLVFSTSTVITQTQLYPLSTLTNEYDFLVPLCSCDGIFVCMLNAGSYCLWNPSIRNSKLLPPLESHKLWTSRNFVYDHFIDNYKVIVVSDKYEVRVNTLGTDYWRRIEDIPFPYSDLIFGHGVFVSGTVNWFARDVILSLHLEKESYQKLSLPDFRNENVRWTLGVVRDCLCVFASSDIYWDVWIMKEYGNKESWTKLYTIPNIQDRGLKALTALYISEDDQLLVQCIEIESSNDKLVVYNPKTGTSNILEFQNSDEWIYPNVYIESLISP